MTWRKLNALPGFLILFGCTVSAPEPQEFSGDSIQVTDDGKIQLSDSVVTTNAPCLDDQILIRKSGSWTCGAVPLINNGNAAILEDGDVSDNITIDNGALYAPANGGPVGIGTNTPTASAALEVRSTSGGLLLPRLTGSERIAMAAPSAGMLVFDRDKASLMIYDGNSWTSLGSKSGNCPGSYVEDTSRTDIILCTNGVDEMVKVGDFWVDRYESTINDSPDCNGNIYGNSVDDYPTSFPDNGQISTSTAALFGCSIRGPTPSVRVTWFQAQQACIASGKHLITNAEWQAAVTGTVDPQTTGSNTNPTCNIMAGAARNTGLAGNPTTQAAGLGNCISLYGAEDMIGNVDEWTSDWIVSGLSWQNSDGESRQWPELSAGFDTTRGVNGSARGSDGNFGLAVPAAIRRGGAYDDGTRAGVFFYRGDSGPYYSNEGLGFRCARR